VKSRVKGPCVEGPALPPRAGGPTRRTLLQRALQHLQPAVVVPRVAERALDDGRALPPAAAVKKNVWTTLCVFYREPLRKYTGLVRGWLALGTPVPTPSR
jgi:hypothetical protein